MRVNVASQTSPRPLCRHHQPLPPPSTPAATFARCRGLRRSESAIFGPTTTALRLSCSPRPATLRRSSSASCYFGEFSDNHNSRDSTPPPATASFCPSKIELLEPAVLGIRPEPPVWPAREDLIRESIARRANCVELPLSLRMIKKKHQQRFLEKGFLEKEDKNSNGIGGVSISKAFSSTVFVIRELHSHALQLRGMALEEDVEPIVQKVQKETNSSFVWLFREVFSTTPDLMADVMVLTVDFAAHSLEKHRDQQIEDRTSPVTTETIQESDEKATEDKTEYYPPPLMDSEDVALDDTKKAKLLDMLERMMQIPNVDAPDERSSTVEEEGAEMSEEEKKLWASMMEVASRMQGEEMKMVEEARIDYGSMQQFISPVSIKIEADDYDEYYSTDLFYQIGVHQDPTNPLLLCNYAQFLYLVTRDYDRAEECFQKAIQLDAMDADVLSQYATFLWVVRKDIWGAEEWYQQAMAAEPGNSYHASKYASFLWSTGGEETCYPLDEPSTNI